MPFLWSTRPPVKACVSDLYNYAFYLELQLVRWHSRYIRSFKEFGRCNFCDIIGVARSGPCTSWGDSRYVSTVCCLCFHVCICRKVRRRTKPSRTCGDPMRIAHFSAQPLANYHLGTGHTRRYGVLGIVEFSLCPLELTSAHLN